MIRLAALKGAAAATFTLLIAGCVADAPTEPPPAPTVAGEPTALTVEFAVSDPAGRIFLQVFADPETYKDDASPAAEAILEASETDDDGVVGVTFSDLPSGRYAVKAFRDVDGDGAFGVNAVGIPTEPYAFSNDARGRLGPAGWDAAAFTVNAPATTHRIRID